MQGRGVGHLPTLETKAGAHLMVSGGAPGWIPQLTPQALVDCSCTRGTSRRIGISTLQLMTSAVAARRPLTPPAASASPTAFQQCACIRMCRVHMLSVRDERSPALEQQ